MTPYQIKYTCGYELLVHGDRCRIFDANGCEWFAGAHEAAERWFSDRGLESLDSHNRRHREQAERKATPCWSEDDEATVDDGERAIVVPEGEREGERDASE